MIFLFDYLSLLKNNTEYIIDFLTNTKEDQKKAKNELENSIEENTDFKLMNLMKNKNRSIKI